APVENVGRRTRAVEGEQANLIVAYATLDSPFRPGNRRPVGERLLHPPRSGDRFLSLQRCDHTRESPQIQLRSSQSAAPCPPPTHSVTSARFALRRCNSFKLVKTTRAPVAPTGWPSAIAPPFTFSLSVGISPRALARPRYLRANESDCAHFNTANVCA